MIHGSPTLNGLRKPRSARIKTRIHFDRPSVFLVDSQPRVQLLPTLYLEASVLEDLIRVCMLQISPLHACERKRPLSHYQHMHNITIVAKFPPSRISPPYSYLYSHATRAPRAQSRTRLNGRPKTSAPFTFKIDRMLVDKTA